VLEFVCGFFEPCQKKFWRPLRPLEGPRLDALERPRAGRDLPREGSREGRRGRCRLPPLASCTILRRLDGGEHNPSALRCAEEAYSMDAEASASGGRLQISDTDSKCSSSKILTPLL
jgi:hypothetical protein